MGQPMQVPAPQPSPTSALVCGILAIVFCFIPIVGIVLGIVAIVLAGKYFKAGGTLGQGKAGRICGIVGIVLSVIMIIVNFILVFTALTVLDDYDTSSRYTSTTTEQTQRSTPSAIATDEIEEAMVSAANAKLDLLKQKDPATVQAIQAMAEATFSESFDSLEEGITMEDCGIVPSVYVDMLLTGFDYEPSTASSLMPKRLAPKAGPAMTSPASRSLMPWMLPLTPLPKMTPSISSPWMSRSSRWVPSS